MKTSTEFRNAAWADIQASLHGMRERVYYAWATYGPGTTENVSARSGISILTFRPRTTELVQLGLVKCVGGDGHDGIYVSVPIETVRAERLVVPREKQMDLL